MKATIFAHNGQVTAISFEGEAKNFNGQPVKDIDVEADKFEAAILEVAPMGVGSPWPPEDVKASVKTSKAVK